MQDRLSPALEADEIATRERIRAAIEGLGRMMARSPEDHADAIPAFHLLTELFLIEISTKPRPARQRRRETLLKVVEIERRMKDRASADRCSAARVRLGISRSYWYELVAEAEEAGLLSECKSPLSTK